MSAEFVAQMEALLDFYAEPYDPQRPKVNFDETSKQLIKETVRPSPARRAKWRATIMNINGMGHAISFCFVTPKGVGGILW